jgi:hypothetical protein
MIGVSGIISFMVLGLCMPVLGEVARSEAVLKATQNQPSREKVIGVVELRPSWRSRDGEFHSENSLELGYRFAAQFQFGYRQHFHTNLYNPNQRGSEGLGLESEDGFFRGKLEDIWRATDSLSLSYEGRVYLPTQAKKREAGLVSSLRNYFRFRQRLSDTVSMSLELVPILHAYSKAGTTTTKGSAANPFFEHRTYLSAYIRFTKRLNLYFPLIIHNTRFSEFHPEANFHNSWGHKVKIWPELTYAVTSNTNLGLAYYSDNLIASDFSATDIRNGLEKGITQVIVRTSL